MRLSPLLLLLLAVSPVPAWSQEHPVPALLVREIEPTDTLRPIDAGSGRILPPASGPGMLTFGALDGAPHEILGGVDAVSAAPDGRILVLDDRNSVIRIVDASGRYLGSVGRAGRGPGDLYHARSMTVDARGYLYVGDLLRRVQRFRPRGTGFELDTVITTGVAPLGLCMMDSVIVVHGVNSAMPGVVHLYDRQGRHFRSFGSVYQAKNEIINHQATSGTIVCLPGAGLIAFMPRSGIVRELRLYDLEGRTRRLSIVAGMRSNHLTETPGGGSTVTLAEDGNHAVASLLATPDERILLQIGLRDGRSRGEGVTYSQIYTAILGIDASARVHYGRGGARVAAFSGRKPVFVVEDPAPAIRWAGGKQPASRNAAAPVSR